MGVAVTVTVKWQFLLIHTLCRISVVYVTLTTSVVSRQQQLLLDLSILSATTVGKKFGLLKVSKIFPNFKTRYFNENSHVGFVDSLTLYP